MCIKSFPLKKFCPIVDFSFDPYINCPFFSIRRSFILHYPAILTILYSRIFRHVKIYDVKDYKVVHSMHYPSPILCMRISVSLPRICLIIVMYCRTNGHAQLVKYKTTFWFLTYERTVPRKNICPKRKSENLVAIQLHW